MDQVKDLNMLASKQRELSLHMVDFDLNSSWNSHWLIGNLRKDIAPLVEAKLQNSDIPFDPQDLEHQTLFYLTTFSPGDITSKVIVDVIEQQYLIIRDRLVNAMTIEELNYLFRGLKLFYPDLNAKYRLKLEKDGEKIRAVGEGRAFEVEFKQVHDQKIISCFTGGFHYIHQERVNGDTFGFFFKGDKYPWAIETTERSVHSRQYKRDALLAHGIDPDNAIELTRLYTLPGSPLNAISMMDKLVKKYYQDQGDIEAIFTCTMPSYSKSKSTTIAGGINKVLCTKESSHCFIPKSIDGTVCWEAVTRRWLDANSGRTEFKMTHPDFRLLPVIDVYMKIRDTKLEPLPALKDGTKAIYFSQNDLT